MLGYLVFGTVTTAAGYHAFLYLKAYKQELEDKIRQLQHDNDEIKRAVRNLKDKLEKLGNIEYPEEPEVLYQKLNGESNGEFNATLESEEEIKHTPLQNETLVLKEQPFVGARDTYADDMIRNIRNVQKEAAELEETIRYYKGSAGERMYKQFNEQLIRYLIHLDRIDSKNNDEIRSAKKDAISFVKDVQAVLKTR